MLHVTNGDSAVERIQTADVPGRVIAWRDVLHEGPVPTGLDHEELREVRARYLAGYGLSDEPDVLRALEERDAELAAAAAVVLWFEHDLYDQLQLLQALDALRAHGGELELVQSDSFLASLGPEELARLFAERRPVTDEQLALAARAWSAFRSPDPTALETVLAGDCSALPFLATALRRHLEQYPSVRSGLARTERLILETVAAGATSRVAVFTAASALEEAIFMGDTIFWSYLEGLSPLVGRGGDALRLTNEGRAVLEGRTDWIALSGGVDRWLGGVRLQGDDAAWRWHEDAGRLVARNESAPVA